jgi:CheY-like chemotaxis protein
MNAPWNNRQPYLALVDDDPETAEPLVKMLLAHGAPSVRWLGGTEAARTELSNVLASRSSQRPDLVVVDLKASPEATPDFITSLRSLPLGALLQIAALAPAPDRRLHEVQLCAGADAVFERAGGETGCRSQAARLVRYWVRCQRLDAVGA